MDVDLQEYVCPWVASEVACEASAPAHPGGVVAPAVSSDPAVSTAPLRCRDTLHIRNRHPEGPYRRVLGGVLGRWAFSYGRGTPVAQPWKTSEVHQQCDVIYREIRRDR